MIPKESWKSENNIINIMTLQQENTSLSSAVLLMWYELVWSASGSTQSAHSDEKKASFKKQKF